MAREGGRKRGREGWDGGKMGVGEEGGRVDRRGRRSEDV